MSEQQTEAPAGFDASNGGKYSAEDAIRDAYRAVEQADYYLNADNWTGDRAQDASVALLRAQALATIAVASTLRDFIRLGVPVENVSR